MTTSNDQAGPQKRPKGRKQQIVIHARDLFVERGFPNVSMAAIADGVGITASALYRHFAGKETLLEAVFADSFAYLESPPRGTSFAEITDEAIEKITAYPFVADLWTHEAKYLPSEARAALRDDMRAWVHAFVPVLREYRAGIDAGQEELLSWAFQSALAGLTRAGIDADASARAHAVRAAFVAIADADLAPMPVATVERTPLRRPTSMRELLLLAAIEQFGRRGYQDTSMASVGAAAGVTGQNLYAYFASKADLLRAAHDRGEHAAWILLEHALGHSGTPREALDLLVAGQATVPTFWTAVPPEPVPEPDLVEHLRGRREYLGDWAALVREAVPGLDAVAAGMRVYLAISLISDLRRTPHLAAHENFEENVAAIAGAVLLSTA